MVTPLRYLLNRRVQIDSEISEYLAASWNVIQAELGIPADFQSPTPVPIHAASTAEAIAFASHVRVPGSEYERERVAEHVFRVPTAAISTNAEVTRTQLRLAFPLHCTRCGLRHPVGTERCSSTARCWGYLVWRREAPKPRYYVEEKGSYGYFEPGPRRLRFVIDLAEQTVFAVSVTLRDGSTWIRPVEATLRHIVSRLQATVATEVGAAVLGELTFKAQARCLRFELPSWVTGVEPQVPFPLRPSGVRLLA